MAYLVSDFWPPKQRQVVRTQPQIKPQIQRVNCIRVPSWRNQIRRNISTEVKAAQFIETESNFIFMQEGREKQYAVFFFFNCALMNQTGENIRGERTLLFRRQKSQIAPVLPMGTKGSVTVHSSIRTFDKCLYLSVPLPTLRVSDPTIIYFLLEWFFTAQI